MNDPTRLPKPGDPMYEAALGLWRHREREFPPHTRRSSPDPLDYATGVWARTVKEAEAAVNGYLNALHKPS
jgi:hypothetical protein